MADITICRSDECLKKDSCYRYLAEPDEKWQSYSYCSCVCDEKSNYKYFLPLEKKEENNKNRDS
jgi:hypothetical protein